jgi:hypothetical protein
MPGTLLIFLLQALANICCRDDGKEIGKGESGVRVRKSKHQGDWMPVDRDQHKDALLAKQQCVRRSGTDLQAPCEISTAVRGWSADVIEHGG